MGCGICGYVGPSGDRQLLESMCQVMKHRGPDQTDYFVDKLVGLGIDRLSIIDVKGGEQPIHNEDETLWIVFNGEIYNYKELRPELEAKRHSFYTESDTECIVHAFEEWGVSCVYRLRGMFAFAIWDTKSRSLFIARDRFGKKPLYHASLGDTFLFGSELKTILQHTGFKRELDHDAVDYFFTYMYIPSPLTIFKGIQKLPPASYAILKDNKLVVTQYWDFSLSSSPSTLGEEAIVDELYKRLEEAVRIRLRSDVALGAFLSGGIDSSTIVALMSRLSDHPVKSVSIGFDDGFSETRYARKVAEFLSTDHSEYTVSADAFGVLPKLLWHFDEPFADHSMIPTFYLSEVTRKAVTVALSGDGGDELFMGYPFLLDPRSYRLYAKTPDFLKRPALRLLRALPVDSQVRRMANHAYEKGYANQTFAARFAMRVTLHDAEGLKALYSGDYLASHPVGNPYDYLLGLMSTYQRNGRQEDPLNLADYATVRGYLEEDILVKVDRMSMAVSLETRCPFLDQEVVSFVEQIPSNLKLRDGETKYILKKLVVKKELLPKEIAHRKKQGFGAPIESWMRRGWKEMVPQILDPVVTKGYTGIFDREKVKSLMADPYVNSSKLFALIAFVLWHRIYLEGDRIDRAPESIGVLA